MNNPLRAGLYARVSTADKGQTTDSQLFVTKKYCEDRGYKIVDEYVEHISAASKHRKEFNRIKKDLSSNRIDLIVVTKLDRFMRSVIELSIILEEIDNTKRGGLISVEDGLDTTNMTGRFMLTITSAIAEYERNLIRERTFSSIAYRREHNLPIGPPTVEELRPELVGELPIVFEQIQYGLITQAEAARRLNMNRTTLIRKYHKYLQENE